MYGWTRLPAPGRQYVDLARFIVVWECDDGSVVARLDRLWAGPFPSCRCAEVEVFQFRSCVGKLVELVADATFPFRTGA